MVMVVKLQRVEGERRAFSGIFVWWDFKGFFVCVSVNGFAWLYIEENEKLFGEKVPKVSCL